VNSITRGTIVSVVEVVVVGVVVEVVEEEGVVVAEVVEVEEVEGVEVEVEEEVEGVEEGVEGVVEIEEVEKDKEGFIIRKLTSSNSLINTVNPLPLIIIRLSTINIV